MMARTHVLISLFFALLLLPEDSGKFLFVFVSIISSFLPDIDSKFSNIGKNKSFRIFQLFLKHRGILHSFLFLFLAVFLLFVFFPLLALPFLLGYGLHLIADSLTVSGIKLFYPFGRRFSGFIRTDGRIETTLFLGFLIGDIYLLTSILFY